MFLWTLNPTTWSTLLPIAPTPPKTTRQASPTSARARVIIRNLRILSKRQVKLLQIKHIRSKLAASITNSTHFYKDRAHRSTESRRRPRKGNSNKKLSWRFRRKSRIIFNQSCRWWSRSPIETVAIETEIQ